MHNASDTFAVLFLMRFKFQNDFKTRFITSVLFEVCRVNFMCYILCLWFRVSLIYINNCPTRCNTKQYIYYSVNSHYMLRVSTAPKIRSTQNCNYRLRHLAYCFAGTSLQRGQTSMTTLEGGSCTVTDAIVTVLCTCHIFCAAISLQRDQA